MTRKLIEADETKIQSPLTPGRISSNLQKRINEGSTEVITSGRENIHSRFGGESDGFAETILKIMRNSWDCELTHGWADVTAKTKYNPDNIPQNVLEDLTIRTAKTAKSIPGFEIGQMLGIIGERFSRHGAEKAIVENFTDAKLAGVSNEFSNIDLICDSGKVQVYTGTSGKPWWNKSNKCGRSKPDNYESVAKKTNFDVFVFVRPIPDEMKSSEYDYSVGAKMIKNEDEKRACSKTIK